MNGTALSLLVIPGSTLARRPGMTGEWKGHHSARRRAKHCLFSESCQSLDAKIFRFTEFRNCLREEGEE
jgi:hypothetical protein